MAYYDNYREIKYDFRREITYSEFNYMSPQMKLSLLSEGPIKLVERKSNIPMQAKLQVWDDSRVDRIVPSYSIKQSYDNLLENSKVTRDAIKEKEEEYRRLLLKGLPLNERQKVEYDMFRSQHIKELDRQAARGARTELEYEQEKIDRIGVIAYVLENIARQIGLLPKETPNKKGNFRIVDHYDKELGKANNLKDAIFIFKQTYKYCKDEDALPFIYEDSIENKPSIIDEDGRLVGYWIKEKE